MKTTKVRNLMSTKRTRDLKKAVSSASREISTARGGIFTKIYQQNDDKPLFLKRALAYQAVLEKMQIEIYENELIVGGITEKRKGAFLVPETNLDGMKPGGKYNRVVKKGIGKILV